MRAFPLKYAGILRQRARIDGRYLMRSYGTIIALAAGTLICASPALADHQPVIAIPSNPHVPVIINGQDASWAVMEGDWGLYRPGQVAPTIYYPYRPYVDYGHDRGYYPTTGKRPRLGRKEIIPPADRRLPPPAESFHRYWSNDGPPVPAQTDYPVSVPPPAVILAPRARVR
jgi:hypothetical protein